MAPWYLRETVTRQLGAKMAETVFILGKIYKAEEALRIGLVDEIVDSDEDLNARCLEIAAQWAKIPGGVVCLS